MLKIASHAFEYTAAVCLASPNYTIADIPLRLGNGQAIPMGYLADLKALRKKRGMTQGDLAERIGVEQPTILRWEKGTRKPDLDKLIELANVLGVRPGELLDGDILAAAGPMLYVKGDVAAGVWIDATEKPEDEWQSFTGRPDIVAKMEHRFGLRVVGDSMNEIYPPGTIVECVTTFGHAEALPGKRVVVIRKNTDHLYEATVKELVEQDGELWAVPRSNNPIHMPIRLNGPEPGILEIRIAAVVVASVRPE